MSQTMSLVIEVAEIAMEKGTTTATTVFNPTRPGNAAQARSFIFSESTRFVVYGSTPRRLASARRSSS